MASKLLQVIDNLKTKIGNEDLSLKDFQKLVEECYKEVYGNKKVKKNSNVKKAPSAYNIFIKEEINKIKNEGLPNVDPKDFMKIAANRWQEHKEKMSVIGDN